MQYRLAADTTWPATPEVYVPYNGAGTVGGGSAVVLDDGRVMYVWSECEPATSTWRYIKLGYADSALDFFTSDDSVTYDRTLLYSAGTMSNGRGIRARIFPDPYYGNAAGFETVLRLCEQGVDGVLRRVVQTW